MEARDMIKNLINIWSIVMASLCYCYYISAKIPKGISRLIFFLPILFLLTILPLYINSVFATAITTFFITWLANFKLVLFAFDDGPLSWHKQRSLPTFIAIAALPIKIKQNKTDPFQKKKLPLNLAAEMLIFAVLIEFLIVFREDFHQKFLPVLYAALLFLLIDILVALSGNIVKALVGLELEPPSNEPYLSTSLQDFWGRRWNLTVTNTLRHTVFLPAKSTLKAFSGNELATLVGVLMSFLVSGLMHELLFYYITRASPSWETTSFFVLHGVCVVLEFLVKRGFKDKVRLPRFVSGALTLGFVVATSCLLFYKPLIRNGVDVKVLQEFSACVVYLKTKAFDLSSWLMTIVS